MTDWAKAYNGLIAAGYSDEQIAEVAGCTRGVVNRVRNGTYPFNHEPGHAGGQRVLKLITDALRQGYLEEDPLK